MSEPNSRFFTSQGLRLHYADWGRDGAPPLILIHGGRDHCRSWDVIARSLRPHFHVLAPDLRGHGDSDWTRGGSYALTEYVYDLARLIGTTGADKATLIGHSMGGMVSLIYAGSFPEQVEMLVVLDGVTVMPNAKKPPTHERIARYCAQLEKLEAREPRGYATIAEAAARMAARNRRLSPDLALHLAAHGVRRGEDDLFRWKFDPAQRVMAPHRLWPEDHVALWSRIACPTLLLHAGDGSLGDPAATGVAACFPHAKIETIADAGHWLHHDKPQQVLGAIRDFLGLDG